MRASPINLQCQSHLLLFPNSYASSYPVSIARPSFSIARPSFSSNKKIQCFPRKLLFISKSTTDSSDSHLLLVDKNNNNEPPFCSTDSESDSIEDSCAESDVEIDIKKIGRNSRRVRARIIIDANLEIVWNVLTDYEKLSDIIPGLAVSQLIEKKENFARLFQVGQQDLAFGVKFKAEGILDCYEKDLKNLPFGLKRDIEFKMVEGDFETFEGKWSIEQMDSGRDEDANNSSAAQAYQTTLSYVVDVKPKLWLPVRLVEGRLCREIKMNLLCIREVAEKAAKQPQFPVST